VARKQPIIPTSKKLSPTRHWVLMVLGSCFIGNKGGKIKSKLIKYYPLIIP
jgi:hypothetical protein